MAYQIKRKNRIKETLELLDADGKLVESIPVDLDVDKIAARVNKAYDALGAAQNLLQKNQKSTEAMEAYGKAVLAVFNVIFTESGTERIVAFYENNVNEMLLDVFPFINDIIMPKIKEASAARRKQLVDATRASKKMGRW